MYIPRLLNFLLGVTLCLPAAWAEGWLTLADKEGKEIVAEVVSVEKDKVTILRKSDRRTFILPLERFTEASQEEIRKSFAGIRGADLPEDLPKRLYPRSIMELRNGLEAIQKRTAPAGIAKDHFDALTLLNSYRFLCHLSDDVKIDGTKTEQATAAAQACEKANSMSHDLGSWTERCNLDYGQHGHANSMIRYIEDPTEKNRVRRGHRSWCLNPPMQEVGFGMSEKSEFSAMWAHDQSGKDAREPWAYPGRGLFPLSHLHGNAWTLYLLEDAPASDDLKVEVTRLVERPKKPFSISDVIPGERLPVPYVSAFERWINFEPTEEPITDPGIFWIRITGGGVREQYLVELIDL